jgi:hypothetical protein
VLKRFFRRIIDRRVEKFIDWIEKHLNSRRSARLFKHRGYTNGGIEADEEDTKRDALKDIAR